MNIKFTNSISLIQFGISIAVLIFTMSIAYATICNKIESLEKSSAEIRTDHDLLLIVKTKLEIIQDNTEEIKTKLDKHIEDTK